jgi:hypothetical protein
MGKEEGIHLHSAVDRGTGFVQGLPVPPDIICHAVWLYYCFPLSLRMVERHWQVVRQPDKPG